MSATLARAASGEPAPLLRVENLVKHFAVGKGFFGRRTGAEK